MRFYGNSVICIQNFEMNSFFFAVELHREKNDKKKKTIAKEGVPTYKNRPKFAVRTLP
jgi:hypothetical protein